MSTSVCSICNGTGRYPVHDAKGSYRFTILCPDCWGSGLSDTPPPDLIRKKTPLPPLVRGRERYSDWIFPPELWSKA